MVQLYTVFGRQIGSHYLAIATLSALFGGTAAAMGGGSKATKTQGPPINATSSDEENFVKNFLKNAEADQKKEEKH